MKQIIPLIVTLLFFSVLIAANIYLAKRFAWYFDLKSIRWLYVLFALTTVFMIGTPIGFMNTTSGSGSLLYSIGFVTLGFMLYLLLSVLVVDISSLVYKTNRHFLGFAAIGIALLVSGYGIWNASNQRIVNVSIPIKGLKTEMKVALLSDVHIGHYWGAKTLQNVVSKTNAENPDVVFITGDLFDGRIRLDDANLSPLKALNAPVYFVEGNHDRYSGTSEIKEKLRGIGVHVLENEVTHFSELQLVGLNHMSADSQSSNQHTDSKGPNIKATLKELNLFPDKPTILLHHSPDGVEYANTHGVDLYLAGHTHAGQLFPIIFIAKQMFEYNKGLYQFKDTNVYVSQGIGTFGPPMRLGTVSEIAMLTLKPE